MTPTKEEAAKYKPLTLKRTYDAPRELVWQAWTDPEQFAKWWSPDGFSIPICEMDITPGGAIRVEMEGPDGTRYPSKGVVKEAVEPERLSVLNAVLDKDGNTIFEVLQSVELIEKDGKTDLTVTNEVVTATPEAAPYLGGQEPGLTQALGKLERVLKEGSAPTGHPHF